MSSCAFDDERNDHRKPVLFLEEKERRRISENCRRTRRDIGRRLKLKTRRLWDGSLHRLTQKNPRPQSERVLRKKRIFQGQGQIEMDRRVTLKVLRQSNASIVPIFLRLRYLISYHRDIRSSPLP